MSPCRGPGCQDKAGKGALQPPSSPWLPPKTCFQDKTSHGWGRERGQTRGPLGLLAAPLAPFPLKSANLFPCPPPAVCQPPVTDATGSPPLVCHHALTPVHASWPLPLRFPLPGAPSLCPSPLLTVQPRTYISENNADHFGCNFWGAHSHVHRPTHLPYPGGAQVPPPHFTDRKQVHLLSYQQSPLGLRDGLTTASGTPRDPQPVRLQATAFSQPYQISFLPPLLLLHLPSHLLQAPSHLGLRDTLSGQESPVPFYFRDHGGQLGGCWVTGSGGCLGEWPTLVLCSAQPIPMCLAALGHSHLIPEPG